MDTRIVELNTGIYEELKSMKSSDQTYTDLIIDLINDDYRYNEIKAFFIKRENMSPNLAEAIRDNLGLDLMMETFGEDVRYAVSDSMPYTDDEYSVVVSENCLEEYDMKKQRTLNRNTRNIEIELFTFNRLFEIGMDEKTSDRLSSDLDDDYRTNMKYYTLNHVLIRSVNNIIEMLIDHRQKLTGFEKKVLEGMEESPAFKETLRNEIDSKKIGRMFSRKICNMLT